MKVCFQRRDFLKLLAKLWIVVPGMSRAGVVCAADTLKLRSQPGKAQVVIAKRPGVLNSSGEVSVSLVNQMIEAGITALTGFSEVKQAWRSLFNPEDVIGIKVNAMGGRSICTHHEVAFGVADSLVKAGIKPYNIIIWDRLTDELRKGGYQINRDKNSLRCFGTDNDYEPEPETSGSIGSCFSTIISRHCNALISIPVLKDHDLSGVSINLKNFYGAIHNPNKYHDNGCDPYIADVNAHPYIKRKLRLIICDALFVQYNGGPGYRPNWSCLYGGLLFSNDPVAVDQVGYQIIDEHRKNHGMKPLAVDGRVPQHIQSAARLNLGIADPTKIETVYV